MQHGRDRYLQTHSLEEIQVLFPLLPCISATGDHGILLTVLLLTQTQPQGKASNEPGGKCSGKEVAGLVFLIMNPSFRFEKKIKKAFQAISRKELAKVSVWERQAGRKELPRAWKMV